MAVSRAEKTTELESLEGAFKGHDVAILIDYKGINVPQVTQLRTELRKAKATYKVVKKLGFAIEGVRDELIQPLGIRFSKDGKRGFVALGRANRIAVIDVEKQEVTNYILVGQRPWHMEMSPDGSKLYTANGLTNDLTIIDVATLKAEKSVPVGRLPWGIAIKP